MKNGGFLFYLFFFLLQRVLWKLNARITEAAGLSFSTGFTVSSSRLAYLDVCDGCKTLTRLFQTQLFINIVANIFSVTFMMLSAFNTLMSDGTDTIRITLYFLYDSLLRALQMYFIIDACHTTIEQVCKRVVYDGIVIISLRNCIIITDVVVVVVVVYFK